LNAHEKAADESWPIRHGDPVDVSQRAPSLSKGSADDGRHVANVISRRELRHDAAVWCVQCYLRLNDVGVDTTEFIGQRGRGFVARGLQA
jgi:hypothetical protein